MLSAKHRLLKDRDIARVMKRGRSFFAYDLSLRCTDNGLAVSRFAVVTSLKVSKKAVLRNQLKRRIREIIRTEIMPTIKPGFDGIVSTRKGLLALEFGDLRTRAIGLFKKARLI